MSDDPILYETEGDIARITLNRPDAYNSMNYAMRADFLEAASKAEADPDVRVIVLAGNGRGFCAGTDLAESHGDLPIGTMLEREYRPMLTTISNSPKLWVSQVHGSAAGIGAAFAMNCDMMVMSDTSAIYMAFAAISLVPDGGNTWLLLRGMGYKRALQAILEGRKIPAEEAVALGLANEMHPEDELAAKTTALAERLAAGAPLAAAAAKRLLRGMDGMSYEAAFSAEGREQTPLAQSNDAKEGIQAFLEKRKANFTGT